MLYEINLKTKTLHGHRYVLRLDVFFLFFNPVLFPNSCLSLEAGTWRKTESPALSATDNYLVSDV